MSHQQRLGKLAEDIYTDIIEFKNYLHSSEESIYHRMTADFEEEVQAYAESLVHRYRDEVKYILSHYNTPSTDRQTNEDIAITAYAFSTLLQFTGNFAEGVAYLERCLFRTNCNETRSDIYMDIAKLLYQMEREYPEKWVHITDCIALSALCFYESMTQHPDARYIETFFYSGLPGDVILPSLYRLKMKGHSLEAFHHTLIAYVQMEMSNFEQAEEHVSIAEKLIPQQYKKLSHTLHRITETIRERQTSSQNCRGEHL